MVLVLTWCCAVVPGGISSSAGAAWNWLSVFSLEASQPRGALAVSITLACAGLEIGGGAIIAARKRNWVWNGGTGPQEQAHNV